MKTLKIDQETSDLFFGKLGFKKQDSSEQTIKISITPEMAALFLKRSEGNRITNPRSVMLHSLSIERNALFVTNNAIGFDKNLVLCDGHHRLIAISKSGKAVAQNVMINGTREGFANIDKNLKRSTADSINMNPKYQFPFVITKNVTAIANSLLTISSSNNTRLSTDHNINEVMWHNVQGFDFVLKNVTHGKAGISNSGIKAAIVCAFYGTENKSALADFCKVISAGARSGIKSESNAALFCAEAIRTTDLSSYIQKSAVIMGNSGYVTSKIYFIFVQICIDHFLKGKDIKRFPPVVKRDAETSVLTFEKIIFPIQLPEF
jgi:hypothetical protein